MAGVRAYRHYFYHVAIATVIGVVAIPYVFATNDTASAQVILVHAVLLWVLAPVFMALADWRLSRSPDKIAARVVHYGIGLTVAVMCTVTGVHMFTNIGWGELFSAPLVTALVPVYAGYIFVVLHGAWRRNREALLRAREAEAKANYAALAASVEPHFLFNSLTTLEELIAVDRSGAQQLLRRLAGFYRLLLTDRRMPTRKLGDEISLGENYLAIQQARFENRLTYVVQAERGVQEVPVPAGIVLTLVENAVKYGIESSQERGTVRIETQRTDTGRVELRVTNPRRLKAVAPDREGAGYGLLDLRERLQLFYGGVATFNLEEHADRVVAVLQLPAEGGVSRGFIVS